MVPELANSWEPLHRVVPASWLVELSPFAGLRQVELGGPQLVRQILAQLRIVVHR